MLEYLFNDLYFFLSDNPEVDIQGANFYKEHLINSAAQKRLHGRRLSQHDILADLRTTSKVESILVCTGVYNPQNDLFYQLSQLFNESNLNAQDDSSDEAVNESKPDEKIDLEKSELKNALSRKNSFISYFDNKYNLPDLTVDNLYDAVQHIITDKILNRF